MCGNWRRKCCPFSSAPLLMWRMKAPQMQPTLMQRSIYSCLKESQSVFPTMRLRNWFWVSRRQIIQICGGDDNSNVYRKGISNALGNFSVLLTMGWEAFYSCLEASKMAWFTRYLLWILACYEQLYSFYPALAFLQLFCFCIYIHFLLKNRRGKVKTQPLRTVRMD